MGPMAGPGQRWTGKMVARAGAGGPIRRAIFSPSVRTTSVWWAPPWATGTMGTPASPRARVPAPREADGVALAEGREVSRSPPGKTRRSRPCSGARRDPPRPHRPARRPPPALDGEDHVVPRHEQGPLEERAGTRTRRAPGVGDGGAARVVGHDHRRGVRGAPSPGRRARSSGRAEEQPRPGTRSGAGPRGPRVGILPSSPRRSARASPR